jgi:polyketide synthase PksL
MIDFIEYVVTELKTKRLSKTNAVALVQQFSRGSKQGGAAVLHPLLHRNTSDLSEQRYGSTFTGQEFFLTDHQVAVNGHANRKVLPGVAYLEMARAAIEQAWPAQAEAGILELRNTVWAQPIVVSGRKDVSVSLLANGDQVEFEIYSDEAGEEVVHCQGLAVMSGAAAPEAIDLESLKAQMTGGRLTPEAVYATCARMGLIYGPTFQGITAIHRGTDQLLAELRLPETVAEGSAEYVLHPSLMDGALQAAVGLMETGAESTQARVPFALETLRIVSPCTANMVAWLRYAPGSRTSDKVLKLDIDLCDDRGDVCVQLRGFSWRVLSSDVGVDRRATGTLFAAPVWQASELTGGERAFAEHHVLSLPPRQDAGIAEWYSDCARDCFERVQAILQRKPQGKVLVQVAVTDELLAGLSGLLRTASLENPQFTGQLLIVPAGIAPDDLASHLDAEKLRGVEPLVRYDRGERQVLRWQETAISPEQPAIALKDDGVYLITGGFGGVGLLFAREILAQTRAARVILTGRSTLTAEKQAILEGLSARASYLHLDLANADDVRQAIAAVLREHGSLHGILHSAGMIADSFIVKKSVVEFSDVLAPKVGGTFHLDEATRDVELDFFVLFSAIAGVFGNLGQSDYAVANGFLDQFAAYRNQLVAAKQRKGKTRSIDWPLWQSGGMTLDAATQQRLQQTTGMHPMQSATGIEAFHRSLVLPYDQFLVAEGDLPRMRLNLLELPKPLAEPEPQQEVAALDAEGLAEKTEQYLRKQFSESLKVPAQKIDARAPLENYGIDSILAMTLTNQLELTFGSLPKTLFFEYQTIRELAGYFVTNHSAQLAAVLTPAAGRPPEAVAAIVAESLPAVPAKAVPSRRSSRRRSAVPAAAAAPVDERVAIVGLSGRYPESIDLDAYWTNLRDGKDCITEVPLQRWNWREYFTDDRSKPGHHYSKWGGFIAGVDEFDPLFFNISPVDAEHIDPQERLFLQHAWMAIEDAGYTRAGLQVPDDRDLPGQVGVYVGVMYTEYQLFGAEAMARGKRMAVPGSAASIANRVSYALNLHGPSMTLDTMCSSSLTAIHLACEDLKHRRTSLAIAGGVNVSIHPNKYLVLSGGQFISSDGHCQSFGEGGDGYIPGEGVGVVVLKRLSEAERDGDHIYGVIRGSALNHGGKTNGYSVPNPQAQAAAISRALTECHTDARHISYIEAHGTGTKLGDPIEIAALSKAFHHSTQDTGFCLIGSAKSNIGHCESAAGIAGLTKILLQFQHQQIVPSLHSAQLNPHIDFGKSPFVVNQTLTPWEQPVIDGRKLPRIAGISSFGAGGSNAHMVIEEYQTPAAQVVSLGTAVIVLSARTAAQLQQKASELLDFVRPRVASLDLGSLAFTLQTGREAMEERLGFVVRTAEELADKLQAYLAGDQNVEDAYQGRVKRNDETLSLFNTDVHLQYAIEQWIVHRKLAKLLDLWVNGLEVSWIKLYNGATPRRMSLPTYPFARERYWIDLSALAEPAARGTAVAVLHPLLHSNTSDLTEQRYSSTFTGDEFFLADHQVSLGGGAGGKVLPGVAYLEMARAAIEEAMPARPASTVLELRNTVWAQPLVADRAKEVNIALLANDGDQLEYEIYSRDSEGDQEVIHCQGSAVFSPQAAPARLDLGRLKGEMGERSFTADDIYAACARLGLAYGPSFRAITGVHRGTGQLLAYLRLPVTVEETSSSYVLHPSLMDGALQSCVALLAEADVSQTRVPFALEALRIVAPCTSEMVAWARYAAGSQAADAVVKLDIDLCDAGGNVCVQLQGFSARALSNEIRTGRLLATPSWQPGAVAAANAVFAEHHVLTLQPDRQLTPGARYTEQALLCFDRVQAILRGKPRGKVLLQVAVTDDAEQTLLAGVSALLKTASLENPQFAGQVILVPAGIASEELDRYLDAERRGAEPLVRYRDGARSILRWEEVPASAEHAPVAFKNDGVYVITGGLGALGLLFATEIVAQAGSAKVVLTGRSPLNAEAQGRLDALSPNVSYRQVDLDDLADVTRLVDGIREVHGRLDGVLHSAGMIADQFILNKDRDQFRAVLAPKVAGTDHLDHATKDVELDFFVLFSSLAGALGNAGQADYAAANGFLDQFAAYRNRLVAAKQRHGRTRSINWPLWQAGGMAIDPERLQLVQQTTGMVPMQTVTGMEAFHRTLALPYDQTLVVEGDPSRIRRALLAAPKVEPQAVVTVAVDEASLAEKTQEYLRDELAGLLKVTSQRIDPQAALEEYGIDSILAMKLTSQLEKTFGSLSKTLFFEYQTIHELTGYFVAHHAAQLTALLAPATAVVTLPVTPVAIPAAPARRASSRRFSRPAAAASVTTIDEPIAIVGLSGRYPESVDVAAYWENLRDGKDCITEVPKERWDWREYFSDDRAEAGRHYSKWGGFISGVDEFDPLFFNISPVDAEIIDPQERLFLQHAWMAMEDAGYTRSSLQIRSEDDLPGQVGVYAGVMYNEYQLFGAEASARGKRMALPGSTASIANRVSYALNLHGPSVTLDTMCSSSLTAIHFACLDLKLGRTSMAIAGGVNVTIHPNKYLVLSGGQFISSDGHCQSFGEGGDGYIPGEGVGVVLLKRLSDAKRDGDHIYGIIRGSALNHGGKTNGYTVPNPQAQATAISRALAESHTDARHVSYIEAHGTGTKLGDPIEIAALSKAFHHHTGDTEFCRIGSAKSNIGHCESAAGIAGLTKVLLQLQHKQIVPSLHSAQLNPHIDFEQSPFVVNQTLRPWDAPVIDGRTLPRIAGISSFGAGGSNAHLIVEEYQAPHSQPLALPRVAILLSARTPEQLRQKALELVESLRPRVNDVDLDLTAVAYTLQVGREAMEERLAFVVGSAAELVDKLQAYVAGERGIADLYQGQVKRNNDALSVFSADADLQQTVDKWIANNKLAKLTDLWVKGLELDWSKLYGATKPPRVSLPVYPFAKERYWIDASAGAPAAGQGVAAVLHPLLHSNTSDLSEQRYRTVFTGAEFFLADHQVQAEGGAGRKVLPGVAYLEMARAAVEAALPERPEATLLEFRNVVWAQPVVVTGATEVNVALVAEEDDQIDFEIYSQDGEQELVHCQGRVIISRQPAPAALDLQKLTAEMQRGSLEPGTVYPVFARMGLLYGPAFQGIRAIHRGSGQLVAQLRMPAAVEENAADFVLHPSLMDSAVQSAVGLLDDPEALVNQPRLPFALETLRIVAPCTRDMSAWVRYAPGSHGTDAVVKVDIDLCDDRGNVCVQMRGFSSRAIGKEAGAAAVLEPAIGTLLATPVWQVSANDGIALDLAERHVVLCELANVDVEELGSWLPLSQVLALDAEDDRDIARRYTDCAVDCFERVQSILQGKPEGKVLVQIVVADAHDSALLAGLSSLLTTASLENPQLLGQVILVPADASTADVSTILEEEQGHAVDKLIRYQQGRRHVLRWQAAGTEDAAHPLAFQNAGVYLITGGTGGLGLLFAREILDQTTGAHVVLTGRGELSEEKQALLDALSAQPARVSYRQLDLGDLDQVRGVLAQIVAEHGRLDGILHSAGMTADRFILTKDAVEFSEVLAPKVTGTFHLDEASRDLELDFFVLFSSIAGAMGNPGQSDYATANGFLDHFAAYRNRLVSAKQRHGRTRSINWPLWQDGGMGVDAATAELLQQTTGMHALRTANGLAAFHRSLSLPHDQLLVVEGELTRLRNMVVSAAEAPAAPQPIRPTAVAPIAPATAPPIAPAAPPMAIAAATFAEKTQDYLRREFSELLKLPFHKIDPQATLENYGIDSILAMRLTNQLEKTFGSLSKTLFFEYQTIASLAGYFLDAHAAVLQEKLGLLSEAPAVKPAADTRIAVKAPTSARRGRNRFGGARTNHQIEIAIVGVGGRYPQAENLQEFWRNLQAGRDSITEVPAERWDHKLYFDSDPNKLGKSYSKWGGFIDDVDKFDSLFFNISPREAALIDPQERLFLETAWQTIEDAGYTRDSMAGRAVGVFVGVMWGQYELFGAESLLRGNTSLPGSSHASIANRVSYFFDFHGPSIALDTMCSSSLTAIHLACDALRKGEIEAAIAGGVNVSIHPYKYVSLSQGKFAATDGRCRSFGAGGDGYVPGEGVGAVLLKPLEHALRDGDQIYATIKSTAINHGGKTNGYTVPNPNAQGELVASALRNANIDPKTLSYIETHGTGTSLGDPIEIAGLLKAFAGSTEEKQFLPIGSVKSNIGHLESAAGIASITKALLQIKYEQLVPSLHASPLNPNINFEDSPFYVQTELADWKRKGTQPRRVGVSSFGAGGSNAHVILEEYGEYGAARSHDGASQVPSPEAFVLSAKNTDALRRYVERVVRFLDGPSGLPLADIAYTSQVGRTPMDARLAIVASSVAELRGKLQEWLAGGEVSELDQVFHGNAREAQYGVESLVSGPAGKAFLAALLANRDLERIVRLWVLGADVDWSLLTRPNAPRRVSLPTYPFAKERHWIRQEVPGLHVVHDVPLVSGEVVAAQAPSELKQRTYYFPRWTPKSVARAESWPSAGPILLVDAAEELFRTVTAQTDGPVVLVKPGQSFQELEPNVYTIDAEREEQFHQLVAELQAKSLLPRTIVHHAAEASNLEERDEVTRELNGGLFTLFNLTKALPSHAEGRRILSLHANGPVGAAMAGFLRTLTLEDPSFLTKTVEADRDLSIADRFALLRDELSDRDWTDAEIRHHHGTRSVRGLVAQAPEPKLSVLPLRKHGVYLLTGGMGGLGVIFAGYLAKNYQAKLVLIGRSEPNVRQQETIEQLRALGAEVLVLQADVSRLDDLERVVRETRARFSELHGVIHAAGVTRDAFILRKTREQIESVLAPKVYGTINLDLATSGENLDFFASFSSIAGVIGNPGQSDYAFGNHFLDSFAETRELLRREQKRAGRTLSINWPLWEEGGMTISRDDVALLEQRTGLSPLPTAEGIRYWEDLLRSDAVQGVALYGTASRIAAFVAQQPAKATRNAPVAVKAADFTALSAKTEAYLKKVIGEEINLSPERIGSTDALESFGIDSIMINRINAQLERDLGELPKTLLYEHETIRQLTAFLTRTAREALVALLGGDVPIEEPAVAVAVPVHVEEEIVRYEVAPAREHDVLEGVAIVGIHGYYPHSTTLDEYWDNLRQGKDLIDLVPPSRWDYEEFYHPDPAAAAEGKIYCKWGGFLEDHDKFDPHFFKISTAEAKVLDPQERLFLESVWAAFEDAGYTRDSLRSRFPKAGSADVGVFVGVTTNSYNLWAPEERMRGNFVSPTALPWSIANRISYFFDFNGPSLPIDTACSSSLVAIHLACESLRNRECQVAVAGGVNLYLHPAKYQSLCQKRMVSLDGKCHSYGAGDDGFVPGEGVGTLILKPLSKAVADQDRIYGVIRGSAYDHSGRSNGYSAPNPNSQARLISSALEKAGIHPDTISYVEGHGTGTQLGDSIEIAALTKAFQTGTARKQYCPIGSVKANIGHSESAAGIAGVAKVLLQLQHGQLAPSIHSDEPNPNIEFGESPFYLQHGLAEWTSSADHPRRALVNSFGAGGVNACVVIEEYRQPASAIVVPQRAENGPWLFTLSARNEERLLEYAGRLLAHLRSDERVDLESLCYTLQTGREAMEERLAIVAADVQELIERLSAWSRREPAAGVHRGSLGPRRGSKRSLKLVKTGVGEQSLIDLAAKWVAGEEVEWESLYSRTKPARIGVPTYPFARERYWVSDAPASERSALTIAHLHPLIAYNSSTLKEVNFSSSLPDTAFYAVDHQVRDERIFPGAGFLEMACIAANMAGERKVRKLTDIVWIRPLSFRNGTQALRTVLRDTGLAIEYEISSFDEENEQVVHSEGRLDYGNGTAQAEADPLMPPQDLKASCVRPEAGLSFYEQFSALGLHYGPSFQTIQELYLNEKFALAKLKIADHLKSEFGQFILHPSIIDGALQTIASLAGSVAPRTSYLPFALDEIEILKPLPQTCYAYAERADVNMQNHAGVTKFHIRLLNESGETLVKFRNLYVRPLVEPVRSSHSAAAAPSSAKGRLLSLSGGSFE